MMEMAELQYIKSIQMNKTLKTLIVSAATLLAVNSVSAATLINNFSTSTTSIGANTVNTLIDFNSNTEWLSVTTTQNQSYDYVSSQLGSGGLYEGWSYASAADVTAMMYNYTLEGQFNPFDNKITYSDSIDLAPFVAALGITKTLGRVFGLVSDVGSQSDEHYYSVIDAELTYVGGDDFKAYYGDLDNDQDKYYIGSFLTRSVSVSPVPTPAAAFLFAPALAGFIAVRRKAKKA
jgi:hypothetical protein